MSSEPESPKPASVLVVDDDPEPRGLYERVVSDAGYRVVAVSSAERALEIVAEEAFDLALLDLRLPGMSGFDLCRHLRSGDGGREPVVIAVSGLSESSDRLHAFTAGAAEYLTKPVDVRELRARVEWHLAERRAQLAARERIHELERSLGATTNMGELWLGFVRSLVHELRSPISTASGYLELLDTDRDALSALHREYVSNAARAVAEIASRATMQLELARLDTGNRVVRSVEIPVSRLVDRALVTIPANDRRRVEVSYEVDRTTTVACDLEVLARATHVLLSQSLGRSPDRETVSLHVREEVEGPPGVRLVVADGGAPMSAERLAGLRDGPDRVGPAASSLPLPLRFCRSALRAIGGSVGARVIESGGMEFWLCVPVDAA